MANLFYVGELKKSRDSKLDNLFVDYQDNIMLDNVNVSILLSNEEKLPIIYDELTGEQEIYSGVLNINNFEYFIIGRQLDENLFQFFAQKNDEVLSVTLDIGQSQNILIMPVELKEELGYQNGAFGKVSQQEIINTNYFKDDYKLLSENIEDKNIVKYLTDEKLLNKSLLVPEEILQSDILTDMASINSFFIANYFQELQIYVHDKFEDKYGLVDDDNFVWDNEKCKYLKDLIIGHVAQNVNHVPARLKDKVNDYLYNALYQFYNYEVPSTIILSELLLNYPDLNKGVFFEDENLLFIYGLIDTMRYSKNNSAEILKLIADTNIENLKNDKQNYYFLLEKMANNINLEYIKENDIAVANSLSSLPYSVDVDTASLILSVYECYQKMFYYYKKAYKSKAYSAGYNDDNIDEYLNGELYKQLLEMLNDVMELDNENNSKTYYKSMQEIEKDGDEMLYEIVSICRCDENLVVKVLSNYKELEDQLQVKLEEDENLNKEDFLNNFSKDICLNLSGEGFSEDELKELADKYIVYSHIAEHAINNHAFYIGLVSDAKRLIQINKEDDDHKGGEMSYGVC